MSVSGVIKAAMNLKGISRAELAEKLGTTNNSLGVKFTRGAWAVDDLIRAAAAMGLQVALVDKENNIVLRFNETDAAPPRRSGQAAAKTDQE